MARDHSDVDPLIEALRDPACYPHPVNRVEVLETHISWVLLAGDHAYKVKKPARLPFLDFSTLEARRHYCEEELRLNRRTAPELYLGVVPIVRTARGPAIAASAEAPGSAQPIEYAVQMRRFAGDALADTLARHGALTPAHVDAIAQVVARFHASLPAAAAGFGTAAQVGAPALGNVDQIAAQPAAAGSLAELARLRAWTARECERLAAAFDARRDAGFVRECHGDLHLGNIAFIDARAIPFDCLEFDPALRCIDVMSEVAFLVMDLIAHGLPALAWRLLNACLEASGDYEGLAVLRFYLVYRAMVRAKIALLRADAAGFRSYLALAASLTTPGRIALLAMHGLSGSGKTTVSQALVERLGAVRVRSDVERKRLHGLDAMARGGAGLDAGIYAAAASRRTYEHLAKRAATILEAGYPALVDAACLQRVQRDLLRGVAERHAAPAVIVACTAPPATLRRRVSQRETRSADASDAGAAVLERQLAAAQPLGRDERAMAVRVDTGSDASMRKGLDAVAARLPGVDLRQARAAAP